MRTLLRAGLRVVSRPLPQTTPDTTLYNFCPIASDVANLLPIVTEIGKRISSHMEEFDAFDDLELFELVEKHAAVEINYILGQANIPQEIYWYVSAAIREEVVPKRLGAAESIISKNDSSNGDGQQHGPECDPKITLIGRETGRRGDPHVELHALVRCTKKNFAYVWERFVLESLRQQLSRGGGDIVCPFAFMNTCCGRKERLRRLYECIPEKYRRYFSKPECGHGD